MKLRKVLLFLFLVGVVFFSSSFPSSAFEFAVAPAKLEYQVKRGENYSNTVKVYNKGNQPITIFDYVEDYSISQDNKFTFYRAGKLPYSASKWISINKREFTVAPGAFEAVTITASPPKLEKGGGHFSVVFFESKNPVEKKKDSVVTKHVGRIGVVVLTTVTGGGTIVRTGRISDMNVEVKFGRFVEKRWPLKLNFKNLFKPEVVATTVFANTGNTYINVGEVVTFKGSWFGTEEKQTPSAISTLPKTKRNLKAWWNEAPFIGPCAAQSEVIYQGSQTSSKVLTASRNFWIIPWNLLLLLVLVFFIIWILLKAAQICAKKLLKKFKDKDSSQEKSDSEKKENP